MSDIYGGASAGRRKLLDLLDAIGTTALARLKKRLVLRMCGAFRHCWAKGGRGGEIEYHRMPM